LLLLPLVLLPHLQAHFVMTEKNLLSVLNHPHIIKLAFSFQDATRLYIGLELCKGELLRVIRWERGPGTRCSLPYSPDPPSCRQACPVCLGGWMGWGGVEVGVGWGWVWWGWGGVGWGGVGWGGCMCVVVVVVGGGGLAHESRTVCVGDS
jgi:hypothetical protein